ncbi:class I tRNA ligase family protein [Amycolatopsis cynarae]|uniref:Methionyl-tRNA synthetase n=1 Tax=Amycolatopsis cynarae TaxID=2995223 RepID=A0ABY7BBN3_9PSEU|nr:class I tRNA ligase family protein [Amycolatopsis sp. HUAS 11-8]WAL68647.1 class I tRNA ligase family protein [Amycolatopsis sp. HUAS 11-8]
MNISTFSEEALSKSFGIDVSTLDTGAAGDIGVGAAWGRVAPGVRSLTHQHDETEMWVIVAGSGELTVDGERHPVSAGSVVRFDPFETHYVTNTGETDLLLVSFFWRDGERAAEAATHPVRRGFGRRPVFVFSSAPTPNGDLHLGHLAGPFFAADAYTRFQRMNGVDAWHLCGSDDFQNYVVAAAEREGRTPAGTAAHYSRRIRETLRAMDIEVHQFTATSADESYPDALRAFFTRLVASDRVRWEEAAALFDPVTGKYLYEAGVTGGCPSCGELTGGNICEGCREPNSVADLVDPVCTASGTTPREGTVKRYSLALHEFAGSVREHHRRGRVPASVKELAARVFRRERVDVPLTHPAEWGVAPDAEGSEGQVIWSWIDYAFSILHGISSLGRAAGEDWRSAEPRADWKIVHFLGADGSFFHPIVIPALYRAAHPGWEPDIDYHLNEFYLLQHSKFSTSRRHAVWGRDVLGPDTVDAVRLYLALTRPEGRRTNYDPGEFDAFVAERLATQWQGWLADLGERIGTRYGGKAPDAGVWTPEHTAFLARLTERLAALTHSLGPDGFSLNRAAETLLGLVDDAWEFSRREAPAADLDPWHDEARTAVALELAAARLLATCGSPVMPRFAAALAGALGGPPATQWPRSVRLVPPGTAIGLAGHVFFGEKTSSAKTEESADSPLLPWLSTVVREVLRLAADEPVRDRSLADLGMESIQAVALQYQLTDRLGADVPLASLLSQDVAGLAASLARDLPADVVREHTEVVA